MKIKLDIDNKTITVLESVNLKKLYKFLKEHIENWQEFNLEQEKEYVDRYSYYPRWVTYPTIYYDSTTTTGGEITYSGGSYTVEIT
ncbi:MAG: hypothetical protein KDC90_18935 [Ignavibacteriae bacterium]|nr:hypothetical protein [Ignavibacteriota bacterium]